MMTASQRMLRDSIVVVTGHWPTESNRISGLFVVQQVAALGRSGLRVEVLISKAKRHGGGDFLSPEYLGLDAECIRLQAMETWSLPGRLNRIPGVNYFNARMLGVSVARTLSALTEVTLSGAIAHGIVYAGLSVTAWREQVFGPVLLVVHGEDPLLRRSQDQRSTKRLLSRMGTNCSSIVLVGSPLRRYVKDLGMDDSKLVVIANGSEVPAPGAVSDHQRESSDVRVLLSVSNLIAIKGIDINLGALAVVAQRAPELNWHYRIVGDGPERAVLEALSIELDLKDRVTFTGRLTYERTMEETSSCDIFTLPSWAEAFGIVYLEAMARMRAVVGCTENGPSDFITHGYDGLLVRPKDVEALADVLLRLIREPDYCRELGQNARATAESLTWDANTSRMRALLAGHARGRTGS